jgi:NAD(P)-dependent dehydrogenase (short-subunit alcohol dehydrogenase family)
MTTLRTALEQYLSMGQGLGYKYQHQARRFADFVSLMEKRRANHRRPCDVADDAQVEAMVAQMVRRSQLSAGSMPPITTRSSAETADAARDDYDRVMAINLRGEWSCMKYELQQMCANREVVRSLTALLSEGLVGDAERGIYHAAKHGILGLTKRAALEYAARGIRICPWLIWIPMADQMVAARHGDAPKAEKNVPMRRVGRLEEIANAVLWICGDAASYVTGQPISVDGGFVMR